MAGVDSQTVRPSDALSCGMKLVLFDIDGTLLWTDGAGALVGLLTGNIAPGAAMKLRSAGLDPARFRVGAYGSDSARRADLPPVAAARAAALTGTRFSGSDVVIVGDTPDDVACSRPFAARAIAVATGSYDVAALRAAGADYVFPSLAD